MSRTQQKPAKPKAKRQPSRRPGAKSPKVKLGPKAMSELFKPARLEVYEALQIAGPSTIAALAKRLERPADSLYYHVRKLLAIGVVEEVTNAGPRHGGPGDCGGSTGGAGAGRPRRKGPEAAVYASVGKRLDAELDPDSRSSREAWAEGGAAVLRLAQRDFARTLESGDIRPRGPRRNVVLRRTKVRLNAAQAKAVNEHIDALTELLGEHVENTTGDLHAITWVMTPLKERPPR